MKLDIETIIVVGGIILVLMGVIHRGHALHKDDDCAGFSRC